MPPIWPPEEGAAPAAPDPTAGRRARESDLLRELDEVTARRPAETGPLAGQSSPAAEDGGPDAARG